MRTLINKQKGYTLLFSVLVSILVLTVGAFILSVTRKQFMLATVARDSMIALYAADSGIECGAMNYFAENKVASTSVNPIQCNDNGGIGIALKLTHSKPLTGNNSATTTFYMPIRIDGGIDVGLACVTVNVGYNVDNSGNRTVDIIEARGYNVGWNTSTGDCSLQTARKVERGLRLMYK